LRTGTENRTELSVWFGRFRFSGSVLNRTSATLQYTMERSIGDLGQDIRQPSNPFGNLCQIAVRRSQINALKAMCPELDRDIHLSKYSHDNNDGYIFLTPRQRNPMRLEGAERAIIEMELQKSILRKWGRICLPNGQIARSVFAEGRRIAAGNTRVTRNVKVKRIFSSLSILSLTIY
jgi:hypothetical protein